MRSLDDSRAHIVAELAAAVRSAAGRPLALIAEDHRNLTALVEPRERGGWALDGIWADDFHHVIRRRLAGDTYAYYQDYEGSTDELARTLTQGWLFTGQHSRHGGSRRGTDPSATPMHRFVICLQNHDQVGNRATGDRLHHAIGAAAWRAASALLLTAPMTPLLFMGQEWAASSPFQYFTDLEPELGTLVTEGRRREFKDFPEFAEPGGARAHSRCPGCVRRSSAAVSTGRSGAVPAHAASLALYTELLAAAKRASGARGFGGDRAPTPRRSDDDTIADAARGRGTSGS